MKTHNRQPLRRAAVKAARAMLCAAAWTGLAAPTLAAQTAPPVAERDDPLESLVDEALAGHPEVGAALRRAEAARARIPQAGAPPDPMLSAGLQNLPLSSFDLSVDGMTMFSVGLEQRFLPRGYRAARTAAAEAEADAARAAVEMVRWAVATRLRQAFLELLLVEQAEQVHHRTHAVLEGFARAAETAYVQGTAPQGDIFRAQTEIAAIHEHLSDLRQRRAAALAEVNAILGRDSRTPVEVEVPSLLLSILEADPGPGLLAASLTGAEIGGDFPTLADLQDRAARRRPELELARHRERAARHDEEATRRDRSPGITVMADYGFRSGREDFFSIGASIELPIFRGRRQDPAVAQAGYERAGAEHERESALRDVRREVAEAHAELLRARDRLILLEESVVPPARAAVESAAASYGSGRTDFTSVLQAQAALYRHEIELAHLTAELGQALVRLERAVGSRLTTENDR